MQGMSGRAARTRLDIVSITPGCKASKRTQAGTSSSQDLLIVCLHRPVRMYQLASSADADPQTADYIARDERL